MPLLTDRSVAALVSHARIDASGSPSRRRVSTTRTSSLSRTSSPSVLPPFAVPRFVLSVPASASSCLHLSQHPLDVSSHTTSPPSSFRLCMSPPPPALASARSFICSWAVVRLDLQLQTLSHVRTLLSSQREVSWEEVSVAECGRANGGTVSAERRREGRENDQNERREV